MTDHDVSNGSDFARLAARATEEVSFDADATLTAVRARARRRTVRHRRVLVGLPVAAVVALGGVGAQMLLAPSTIPAAQAYELNASESDPVLAELSAGLLVHYLPADLPQTLELVSTSPAQSNGAGAVVFESSCYSGPDDLALKVCISTAPDLNLTTYLEHNWFEGTETTVWGEPALVNAISADGAGGIVFSPESGTVVEIHVATRYSDQLRPIVEGMSLSWG